MILNSIFRSKIENECNHNTDYVYHIKFNASSHYWLRVVHKPESRRIYPRTGSREESITSYMWIRCLDMIVYKYFPAYLCYKNLVVTLQNIYWRNTITLTDNWQEAIQIYTVIFNSLKITTMVRWRLKTKCTEVEFN